MLPEVAYAEVEERRGTGRELPGVAMQRVGTAGMQGQRELPPLQQV